MAKKTRSRRGASRRAVAEREPRLEAISVIVAPSPGRDPLALARAIARRTRLAGWRVDAVTDDGTELEIVPPRRNIGAARAWDVTYTLRDQPEVAHAEPMFRYLVPENAPRAGRKASGTGRVDDPATNTDYA